MRSLYIRIFLAIGTAILICMIAALLISFTAFTSAVEESRLAGPRQLLGQAASALSTQGREGLTEWLREAPGPAPNQTWLILDSSGKEILGRSVPERWRNLARRPPPPERGQGPRNFRPSRLLPRLVGPDGEEYVVLRAPRRFSGLTVLGWPSSRLQVLAVIILVTGAMSLLLARYIARPVTSLKRATQSLAAGQLDTRLGDVFANRRDELGALARSFDAMAERIQRLVREREELLRDVSHELRSPLARLRVALALAQRNAPAESAGDLERIEKEATTLEGLIDQLMALARLQSSVLVREPVRLDRLLEEIVNDARFEYGDERIQWRGCEAVEVLGQQTALRSAIENVVRNALAYSPSDRPATVALTLHPGRAVVTVTDSGPGVPESDLERIFEPLFRVDASRNRNSGGEGIGLAITARVTELHGGSVAASNRADRGLEVRIELPTAG